MAGFSINESLFVIDMDDDSPSILQVGEILADGIKIGVDRDRGEEFAFYVSEDGHFDILAAKPRLAERWVQEGYLQKHMLQLHLDANDEIDCYLLISPSSHILSRMTDIRVYGSRYYAHMVASAMWHSRNRDAHINLRDGIICELYGVVLPTYTLTPMVADLALLNNVLRGQYDSEDLRSPDDFARESNNSSFGGLNRISFNQALKAHDMAVDTVEPYFQLGEEVDDFVQLKTHAIITGALELRPEFQLYATSSDMVLLVLENHWAQELIDRNLLLQMNLKPVPLGGEPVKALPLPRRYAVEALNNRHFGLNQSAAFDLALALQRARHKMPEASFKDALYVQELGLVLPTKFSGGNKSEDVALIREIVSTGPFAQGPFLADVVRSCEAIVGA